MGVADQVERYCHLGQQCVLLFLLFLLNFQGQIFNNRKSRIHIIIFFCIFLKFLLFRIVFFKKRIVPLKNWKWTGLVSQQLLQSKIFFNWTNLI